jgi:uncharacterized protein
MGSVVVAFSGGVDSAFLLKVATEELGEHAVAVTARSPAYIDEEYRTAADLADRFDVEHVTIHTDETDDPDFARNPTDRCYHCKQELFGRLQEVAERRDIGWVIDASNLDDCSDYRPGMRAAEEMGVRSPLVEAGLRKEEIRQLSHQMDLPTWDKPAMACLASRFPYGEEITPEKLDQVERAESFLRERGFQQVRVRVHGEMARIEVPPRMVNEIAEEPLRSEVVNELKGLGFAYVAVDLEGYRSGSMNEVLSEEERAAGGTG